MSKSERLYYGKSSFPHTSLPQIHFQKYHFAHSWINAKSGESHFQAQGSYIRKTRARTPERLTEPAFSEDAAPVYCTLDVVADGALTVVGV